MGLQLITSGSMNSVSQKTAVATVARKPAQTKSNQPHQPPPQASGAGCSLQKDSFTPAPIKK